MVRHLPRRSFLKRVLGALTVGLATPRMGAAGGEYRAGSNQLDLDGAPYQFGFTGFRPSSGMMDGVDCDTVPYRGVPREPFDYVWSPIEGRSFKPGESFTISRRVIHVKVD